MTTAGVRWHGSADLGCGWLGPKTAARLLRFDRAARLVAASGEPRRSLADIAALVRRAVDWYGVTYGATLRGEPHELADGTVGHTELSIGDSVLMLTTGQPLCQNVHLLVTDIDGTSSVPAPRVPASRRNRPIIGGGARAW